MPMETPTHRTTASVLRLRASAIMGDNIIGRLPQGTLIKLLHKGTHPWVYVRATLHDGMLEGWVSGDFIEAIGGGVPFLEPAWMPVARAEIGVREYPGPEHNPRIIAYHATTTLKATTDETAWCSSFVNWCVGQAGIKGTNSAAARSWLKWEHSLQQPVPGCIAVFRRGNNNTSGHVAFFLEKRGSGILVLGGNQSNSVKVSSYPEQDLLDYRMTM